MRAPLAVILIAAGAAAGYLGGYLGERRRVAPLEAQARALTGQLAEARALLRIHALHDQVLDLVEASDGGQYSRALALSTELFDDVRALAYSTETPRVRQALESVPESRDKVTAALAKRDPSLGELLTGTRRLLHPLLLLEPGTAPPETAPAAADAGLPPGSRAEPAR